MCGDLVHHIDEPIDGDDELVHCDDEPIEGDPYHIDSGSESDNLVIDTGEEETGPKCSVCQLQFPTQSELRLHFRSHGMAFLQTVNNR